jgi:hypothetical protein
VGSEIEKKGVGAEGSDGALRQSIGLLEEKKRYCTDLEVPNSSLPTPFSYTGIRCSGSLRFHE